MKFTYSLFIAGALVAPVYCAPFKRDVDPALVPEFGLASGLNPTGTGDCDGIAGANGQPIKIPCACPPDRASFLQSLNANLAAGKVVNNPSVGISFPTDSSQASQLARIQAALVTLQNQRGPGVGCPASSTTFLAQQKAIQAGGSVAAAAPAGSAPATTSPASSGGVNEALVPAFGITAGTNPTGTGDCDGVAGPNGQPIKIPCACPPDRASFIQSLNANVAAGHIVNNPGIAISFPADDSTASQITRIQATLTTLQNLRGPGQGCPASSTNLLSQLKTLQGI